jgi:hypothetical protein
MTPQEIALLAQGLQAAIAATPQVIAVAQKAADLIKELATAEAITVEQQDALQAHMNAVMDAALAGENPPHWKMEPDPTT